MVPKIKKPLQGSLKRLSLVRPSRTPAPLTAAGSPGPPLVVVAMMMGDGTPATDAAAAVAHATSQKVSDAVPVQERRF